MFGGFLAKLVRNLSLDRYRARTAKKRGGAGANFTAVLSELDECLPSLDNVEEEYEAGQTAELINRFLEELPEIQRELFTRRYWNGEPLADVAADYGISYSKAGSLLHRLRKKLKTELEKEGIII
jgi:RNA polymerase sigma-70 factor (ECF subfamily)